MSSIRSRETDPPTDVEDSTYYVLGDDHVGSAIAEQLHANGYQVTIVGESQEPSDFPGFAGNPSAVDVLSESGIGAASAVVVATRSDRRNLLIAQLVNAHFDVSRVVVLVNDPDRTALFTEAGHEPVCVTTVLSRAVGEAV
jgi:Trk K+ transport system NAD-binding subunit